MTRARRRGALPRTCTRSRGGSGRSGSRSPRAARPTRCCSRSCSRSPGIVVAARRTEAPWARAFKCYLLLGVVVIAIRVGFRIVLGGDPGPGEHVLFTIPADSAARIHVGRTARRRGERRERAWRRVYDGLRLATLLCCIGAANTLANPEARAARAARRAVRARRHDHRRDHRRAAARRERAARPPGAQAARRHRAGPAGGARHRDAGAARRARPVVPARGRDGLARVRTHGRRSRARAPRRPRRCCSPGSLGLCLGIYGLLDTSTPRLLGAADARARRRASRPAGSCSAAGASGARATGPIRGSSPEWCTALSGVGRRDRDHRRREPQRVRAQPVDRSRSRGRRCPLLADDRRSSARCCRPC